MRTLRASSTWSAICGSARRTAGVTIAASVCCAAIRGSSVSRSAAGISARDLRTPAPFGTTGTVFACRGPSISRGGGTKRPNQWCALCRSRPGETHTLMWYGARSPGRRRDTAAVGPCSCWPSPPPATAVQQVTWKHPRSRTHPGAGRRRVRGRLC